MSIGICGRAKLEKAETARFCEDGGRPSGSVGLRKSAAGNGKNLFNMTRLIQIVITESESFFLLTS